MPSIKSVLRYFGKSVQSFMIALLVIIIFITIDTTNQYYIKTRTPIVNKILKQSNQHNNIKANNKVICNNNYLTLFTDGGSNYKYSFGYAGYILLIPTNNTIPWLIDDLSNINVLSKGSIWLGRGISSHEAEYYGLIEGLLAIKRYLQYNIVENLFVNIYLDSEIIVKYINSKDLKLNNSKLLLIHDYIMSLMNSLSVNINIQHISRCNNVIADQLANQASISHKSEYTDYYSVNYTDINHGLIYLYIDIKGNHIVDCINFMRNANIYLNINNDSYKIPDSYVSYYTYSDSNYPNTRRLIYSIDFTYQLNYNYNISVDIEQIDNKVDRFDIDYNDYTWNNINFSLSDDVNISVNSCISSLSSLNCLNSLIARLYKVILNNELRHSDVIISEILKYLYRYNISNVIDFPLPLYEIIDSYNQIYRHINKNLNVDMLQCVLLSGDSRLLKSMINIYSSYYMNEDNYHRYLYNNVSTYYHKSSLRVFNQSLLQYSKQLL